MKPLEQLPLGQRIIVAILITVAALIALLVLGRLFGADEAAGQPSRPDFYTDLPVDSQLLRRDRQALDDAYQQQLVHLFTIWLKGQAYSDKEIATGLKIARRAYATAAEQITRREEELLRGAPK